jgi:N-acetyl-anhydromuramyl-L-alanine amidase AmpD
MGVEAMMAKSVRPLRRVILHHTASPLASTSVDDILRWHLQRGMSGIGYHFVIAPDGLVHHTRWIQRVGAHTRGHNLDSVGVALIGDFEREQPTESQVGALVRLLEDLKREHGLSRLQLHGDLTATCCPGRNLRARVPLIVQRAGYNLAGE